MEGADAYRNCLGASAVTHPRANYVRRRARDELTKATSKNESLLIVQIPAEDDQPVFIVPSEEVFGAKGRLDPARDLAQRRVPGGGRGCLLDDRPGLDEQNGERDLVPAGKSHLGDQALTEVLAGVRLSERIVRGPVKEPGTQLLLQALLVGEEHQRGAAQTDLVPVVKHGRPRHRQPV